MLTSVQCETIAYCATAIKEKFQPLLTVVRGRCSWLLSTLGGPPHDHGRNSSHDPGVGGEEEKQEENERG